MNATDFDHTFIDFYNSQILRHDTIIEFDKTDLNADALFSYVNGLIADDPRKELRNTIEYFLCGYLSVLDKKHSLPYVSNSAVTDAVNLIHNEYASLSTKLLAKKINLDGSYFIRLFSSVMGVTPMKYIRACRVAHGKRMLQSGASVAKAAEKCGYKSPSAFYNAVNAELNLSPLIKKNESTPIELYDNIPICVLDNIITPSISGPYNSELKKQKKRGQFGFHFPICSLFLFLI